MTPLQSRIAPHVTEEGDCLLWRGGCCNGHPAIQIDGGAKLIRRELWKEMHGEIGVYIDRWFARGPKRLSPVWCAVSVPANCPKPATKLPTRSQSRYRAFLHADSGMSFKEWMRARP